MPLQHFSGHTTRPCSGLAANSWSKNRIDIVGRGEDYNYWHKYWDGTSWKPSDTQLLAAYYTMKLFEEAGLPSGVINFVWIDCACSGL